MLSTEELQRLLAVADEPWRTIFALLAGTGLRIGEALGVSWRSPDLEDGWCHVREQAVRSYTIEHEHVPGGRAPLKTARARRTLPLPADLVELLEAHRRRCPDAGLDGAVFAETDQRRVQRALRGAVDAAEIEEPEALGRITPHRFRRSYASRLIAHGADVVEVQAALGHATRRRRSARTASSSSRPAGGRRGALAWRRRSPVSTPWLRSVPESGPEGLPLAA